MTGGTRLDIGPARPVAYLDGGSGRSKDGQPGQRRHGAEGDRRGIGVPSKEGGRWGRLTGQTHHGGEGKSEAKVDD